MRDAACREAAMLPPNKYMNTLWSTYNAKKKLYILTQTYTFSELTNRKPSETDSDSKLIPSPHLSHSQIHANTSLPDNFSHCSQTPNGRELRGFKDDFWHKRGALKMLLRMVFLPKCMFVWTHAGALTPRCYSCVTDTKMMFLTETPDTNASSWTGWMMRWQ